MSNRIIRLACLLALVASAVLADQEAVSLGACNTNICNLGLGSPYGTVTKTLISSDPSLQFDSSGNPIELTSGTGDIFVQLVLNDGLVLINDGLAFNSSVPLNLTSGCLTTGCVTSISPGNYGPLTAGKTIDGFGSFQYMIPGPNNGLNDFTGDSSTLSFIVIGPFSTVGIIDQPGNKTYEWAAHVGSPDCATNGGTACTGDIANGTSSVVPEPGTIALFGMGLLGAGVVIRRRRK